MNKLSYFILSVCLTGTMVGQGYQNQPQLQKISLDDKIALYMREVAMPVSENLPKALEEKKDFHCRMAGDFYGYLPTDWMDDDRSYNAQAESAQRSCARGRESMDALLQRSSLDAFSGPIFLRLALPLEQKMQKDRGFSNKEIELMRKEIWSRIRYEDKPIIKRNFFLKEL